MKNIKNEKKQHQIISGIAKYLLIILLICFSINVNAEMKRFLVIVDVQNDFVDGSLGTKEAQEIIPRLVKKLETEKYDMIYCTFDTHTDSTYLSSKEGQKLPVKHCIFGTEGHKLNSQINDVLLKISKENGNVVPVIKYTFGSEKLVDLIFENNCDELTVEFVGLCTDICVIANVVLVKTAFYNTANIVIDASCCAGVTPEKHKAALEVMKSLQIDVINE